MEVLHWRKLLRLTGLPVLIASLCCVTPVVLVLLGLSTVSFAAALSDILYYQYDWVFQLSGLLLLAVSLGVYFYHERSVCTIDEAVKRRREIINTVLAVLVVSVMAYVIWLFVVVELIGVSLGVWEFNF